MKTKNGPPDWRKWLPTLHEEIELHDPASAADIKAAAASLGTPLPDHLVNLLRSTNGVLGPYGAWLVWPLDQIVAENRAYRSQPEFKDLYMPFEHLLLIGEAGNGDLFAYPVTADGSARNKDDIFRWHHELDERRWAANNLAQYLKGFTDGTIEV